MSDSQTQPLTPVQPTSPSEASATAETVVLPPSFRLSLGLGAIALPLLLWQPWIGGPILLLAAFLTIQTARIRLAFTPTELEVRLGERLLRQFPYTDWLNWELFWSPIPILFYFREVNSIHFLPVLFDAQRLKEQLTRSVDLSAR